LRRPSRMTGEDRSVAEFIRDHYGQEAVDYLAEPLLAGVYGGDPEQLSVASVLPLFAGLEQKYGSLTRGVLAERRRAARRSKTAPLFQTLRAGLGALVDALQLAVSPHMQVVEDTAVAVERREDGFCVQFGGGSIEASAVVLACQAYEAGTLVRSLDAQLADQLVSIRYNSSTTVALGYEKDTFDRPLNGFGFLIPRKERRRLVAGTWVGTKFSHRVPEDKVLLRCFLSGEAEADEELLGQIREELREIMGVTAKPAFTRISRWPRSMAQYTVGHQRRIEAVETRLCTIPGLYVAGNAYHGIGVPDCVRMGQQAAGKIASSGLHAS
jgi:protoporphyrinogen/coproporphyrinogen III oxidase